MTPYRHTAGQRQQPRQTRPRFGRAVLGVGILVVLFLIVRAIFSDGETVETSFIDERGDPIAALQEQQQNSEPADAASDVTAADEATDVNTNADVNSNTAATTAAPPPTAAIDVAECANVIARGSTTEKRVSLTFNVGTAKAGAIADVLRALRETDTTADFFARGDVAEENPDLITDITNAGFPVYNLSYNHPDFTDLPESGMAEQLTKADTAISELTGRDTTPFFRPPYGSADDDVVRVAREAGYCTVRWTVDAMDWSSEYTAAESKERVLSQVNSGAIILMQAGNAITAEIVPQLISELKEREYAIVSLGTLLE